MTSSPEASLDAERLKPNSFMQAHNEPENTSHGNPVLSLDEEVEIYEFPESACDGIPSKFDVSGVLGGIEGDVAVVIAEDGEKATSQWEANVTDGECPSSGRMDEENTSDSVGNRFVYMYLASCI